MYHGNIVVLLYNFPNLFELLFQIGAPHFDNCVVGIRGGHFFHLHLFSYFYNKTKNKQQNSN